MHLLRGPHTLARSLFDLDLSHATSEIAAYSTFQALYLPGSLPLVATGIAHQTPPLEQLACPGAARSF